MKDFDNNILIVGNLIKLINENDLVFSKTPSNPSEYITKLIKNIFNVEDNELDNLLFKIVDKHSLKRVDPNDENVFLNDKKIPFNIKECKTNWIKYDFKLLFLSVFIGFVFYFLCNGPLLSDFIIIKALVFLFYIIIMSILFYRAQSKPSTI